MNVIVPIVLVVLIVGGSLYAYFAVSSGGTGGEQYLDKSCRQVSEEDKNRLIDGFMKKDGYDVYKVVAISDQYCSDGVGLYNVNAEATINPNSPTEHRKTLRFQIRSTHNETKIYEVVLANPAG